MQVATIIPGKGETHQQDCNTGVVNCKVLVMKIENTESRLVDEQKQKFVGIIKINHLSTMFSIIKGGIWLLFTGEEYYSVPGDKVEIVLLD